MSDGHSGCGGGGGGDGGDGDGDDDYSGNAYWPKGVGIPTRIASLLAVAVVTKAGNRVASLLTGGPRYVYSLYIYYCCAAVLIFGVFLLTSMASVANAAS